MNIADRVNKTGAKFILFYIICVTFLAIAYQPSFSGMFRNDDWVFMRGGVDLWNNFDLIYYFKHSITAKLVEGLEINHFQILANFLSYCKYYLFGNNLFLHHLISFLVHCLNALLLLWLSYLLTMRPAIAITSMFLFAGSYLIFDTVSWAGQWNFLNVTALNLISLILLTLYLRSNGKKLYFVPSIFFAFVGMFIFEVGIFIPISLAILSFYFIIKKETKKAQFTTAFIASGLLLLFYFIVYLIWVSDFKATAVHDKIGFLHFGYYIAVALGTVKMIWAGLGQPFDSMILDSYYITNVRVSFLIIIPACFLFLIWRGRKSLKGEIVLICILLVLSIFPFALISISRYMTDIHLKAYGIQILSPLVPRYYYVGYPYFALAIACLLIIPCSTPPLVKRRFITYAFIGLIVIANLVQTYRGNIFIIKELEPIKQMVYAMIDLLENDKRDKYILPYGKVEKMSWGFNISLKYFFFKDADIVKSIEQSHRPEYIYYHGRFKRIF
jgi:hypothetical protein